MSEAASLNLQPRQAPPELAAKQIASARVAAGHIATPVGLAATSQVAGYTIVVASDPAQIEPDWRALEAAPTASAFQSYRWCAAWSRTVAPVSAERPFILAGYDGAGEIAFVLPLSLNRRNGLSVLTWLGQSHANYNLGVWRADLLTTITPATAQAILQWAAKRAGADAACLTDQPGNWLGAPNPFVTPKSTPASSNSYALDLDADFTTLYARKFGSKTRASLKRKDRRLQDIAPVSVEHLSDDAARIAHLDNFFQQKAAQFAEQGVANIFADPALQKFYFDLASGDVENPPSTDRSRPGNPSLSLMRLNVGPKVAATFNGIRFGERFYLLTLSLTDDAAIRRCSPGLRLMREQIAHCCADGVKTYDFGTGEGDHKSAWDAVPVPLWDSFVPFSIGGQVYCQALAAKRAIKRGIKSSPRLWSLVRSARRLRALLSGAGKPSA